jgi:hypothetical protein
MADQRIKIPRASDKSLFTCFKELSEITGITQISITALGFNNIGTVDLSEDLPDSLSLILKKNSAIIETISLGLIGLPIRFYRGGNYPVADKSGVFDEVVLAQSPNQGTPDSEVVIEVVSTINKKLKAFDPKRAGASLTEEQAQFEAIHTSNIERLESLNEDLIKSTHDYRLQLDEEYREKANNLDSEHRDKTNTLDENFQSRNTDLDTEFKKIKLALEEQEQKLEDKRKELDDNSNTHARREIRRDILKEIKSRQTKFSLTDGTNNLRKPIAIAMLGLIAIFVTLGAISAKEFYDLIQGSDLNKIIIAGIKQAIYSGGAIASVIFLIRWMNRWFELHSQSEFSMKQFELDMERASWLVETSLEWKDAKGSAIPTELLESLSKNLFVNENQQIEQIQHPADQLASALIGSASSVKLKAGESSIEIDPKKLAKVKQPSTGT